MPFNLPTELFQKVDKLFSCLPVFFSINGDLVCDAAQNVIHDAANRGREGGVLSRILYGVFNRHVKIGAFKGVVFAKTIGYFKEYKVITLES